MPTVDELLGDATGIEPAYLNDDIQYVIDENLRTVTIPEDGVVLGVKGDKDTNRVNFQMMRYYNGFDLSEFKFRVNYENANGGLNFYEVTDSTVYEDVIYFTWLVDAFAAAYVGEVNFSVRLYKTEGTKVTQNFYTTHNSATVLEGVLADEDLDENNIEDLIEHLKRVIEEYGYEIAGPLLVSYLLDHNLGTEVTEEMVRRLLNTEYFSKMAFVKHTGANEFEYNESALEAKIKAYTYSRDETYSKSEIDSSFKATNDDISEKYNTLADSITTTNEDTMKYVHNTRSVLTEVQELANTNKDRIKSIYNNIHKISNSIDVTKIYNASNLDSLKGVVGDTISELLTLFNNV